MIFNDYTFAFVEYWQQVKVIDVYSFHKITIGNTTLADNF